MGINLSNLSEASFKDNLNNNEGEYDEFDLNFETDTVQTLLTNEDDIQALAEAILEDIGGTASDVSLEDLVKFIKLQAQNSPKEISIQAFMTSVIVDLKNLAAEDDSLSVDELQTGITREQQQVGEAELTAFVESVLVSIADQNGYLNTEDAPLLASLLGIEVQEAKEFIGDGITVGKIIDVFAGKDGDNKDISYQDLDLIKK